MQCVLSFSSPFAKVLHELVLSSGRSAAPFRIGLLNCRNEARAEALEAFCGQSCGEGKTGNLRADAQTELTVESDLGADLRFFAGVIQPEADITCAYSPMTSQRNSIAWPFSKNSVSTKRTIRTPKSHQTENQRREAGDGRAAYSGS